MSKLKLSLIVFGVSLLAFFFSAWRAANALGVDLRSSARGILDLAFAMVGVQSSLTPDSSHWGGRKRRCSLCSYPFVVFGGQCVRWL